MRAAVAVTIILNLQFSLPVLGLYCNEIKELGTGAKFSIEVLKTISDDDLISCLVYLGKDPLGYEEGKFIWQRLTKIYEGVSSIPESDLQQLGWITRSIPIRDIANLTIGDIDTIAAFGQYHNLSFQQALAEQVRDDWSGKEATDYTFYDLMALKHILCGFNRSVIETIHPDSYKEAATVLATLRDCRKEQLEALASLAMSEDAFGDPSTWHSSQVKSVGCVINGLTRDEIARIPPEGIESITPDIIPCLERNALRAMSSEQLKHLTPSAVATLTYEQKSVLSSEQRKAVDIAYQGNTKQSGSNYASIQKTSYYSTALLLLLTSVLIQNPMYWFNL